jgi:hypothetical protein
VRRAGTEQRIGQQAVPSLGQSSAAERLSAATKNLQDARALHRTTKTQARRNFATEAERELRAATARHEAEKRAARASFKEQTRHARESERYEQAAPGYFHRVLRPEYEGGAAAQAPGRGGMAKTHGRKDVRALRHMTPEDLEKYSLNIPESIAKRVQASHRVLGTQELNARIAGLGDVITAKEALEHVGAQADLFAATPQGPRALFNKLGVVDRDKVVEAARAGHRIVKGRAETAEQLRYMASGERAKLDNPLSLKVAQGEYNEGVWARASRNWKWLATIPNAAYHVRNMVGDTLNARIAGVRAEDVNSARRLAKAERALNAAEKHLLTHNPEVGKSLRWARSKTVKYPGWGEHTLADTVQVAIEHGITGGGETAATVRKAVDLSKRGGGGQIRRKARALKEGVETASQKREELMRLATFHRALKNGMSPEAAAAWTHKHLFDYGELSAYERNVLRNVVPFWTWQSRNLPLQVGALATSPGVAANFEKLRRGTLSAAGLPQNVTDQLPAYQQDSPPWAVPGWTRTVPNGKGGTVKLPMTLNPNLPTSAGLALLPLPLAAAVAGGGGSVKQAGIDYAHKLAAPLHPFAKYPFEEAVFQKSSFTGADLKPREAAPGWAQAVGLAGHREEDPRTGKMVPTWPGYAKRAANILPLGAAIAGQGVPTSKTGTPRGTIEQLGPINPLPGVKALDLRSAKISELYRQNAIDLDKVDELRKRHPKDKLPNGRWKEGSPVWQYNKRIAKRSDEIEKLTAQIQGVSPKKKTGRKPARARMPGGFGGGFDLGFKGGGFGGQ